MNWREKMEQIIKAPWKKELPVLTVRDIVQTLGYIKRLEKPR